MHPFQRSKNPSQVNLFGEQTNTKNMKHIHTQTLPVELPFPLDLRALGQGALNDLRRAAHRAVAEGGGGV